MTSETTFSLIFTFLEIKCFYCEPHDDKFNCTTLIKQCANKRLVTSEEHPRSDDDDDDDGDDYDDDDDDDDGGDDDEVSARLIDI